METDQSLHSIWAINANEAINQRVERKMMITIERTKDGRNKLSFGERGAGFESLILTDAQIGGEGGIGDLTMALELYRKYMPEGFNKVEVNPGNVVMRTNPPVDV